MTTISDIDIIGMMNHNMVAILKQSNIIIDQNKDIIDQNKQIIESIHAITMQCDSFDDGLQYIGNVIVGVKKEK